MPIGAFKLNGIGKYIAPVVSGYTVPTAAFTSDASTKLLLHLENGTTDSSGTPHTMLSGNGVTYSSANKKFGTYSANFPASTTTNPYIQTTTTSTDFTWVDKDFTIEYWIYLTNYTDMEYAYGSGVPKICGKHDQAGNWAWSFGVSASGYPKIYYYNGGYQEAVGSTTVSTGAWHHVMFDFRNSDKRLRIGLDGSFVHTSTRTGITDPGGNAFIIGTIRLNAPTFQIDEVRVSHTLRY